MGRLALLFLVGYGGGLIFDRFRLPGGVMTGAMLAVVVFKACGSMSAPPMPHAVKLLAFGCVGIIVGNMYNPGMLAAVRETWPVMLLSTGIILLAGLLCAQLAARWGGLSVGGAYMATSPGGFNAMVALSGGLDAEAPIVMIYHLVRIYSIVLLSPYIGRILALFFK